jgi:hypothetical protein
MRWGLTRTLPQYVAGTPSVGGKAPKWVLTHKKDPQDFYIAKLGSTNGRAETFTELFNNQIGNVLGFDMAHSGVIRLDFEVLDEDNNRIGIESQPYFVTKNFRAVGSA